jgi:hypothetical protein
LPLREAFTALLAAIAPYCLKMDGDRYVNGRKMMPRTAGKLLSRIWDLRFDLFEATDDKGFPRP